MILGASESPSAIPAYRDRALSRLTPKIFPPRHASGRLAGHHQAAAEHLQRRLDLVEARGMAAVEQPRHLRRLPAEAFGELLLVEPGGAHRPVGFELGRGQGRQGDRRSPPRRRWQGHVFAMREHAEDGFFEQILGLGKSFRQVVALGRAVADIRQEDDVAAIRLGFEPHRIGIGCAARHDPPQRKSSSLRPRSRRMANSVPRRISPLPVGTIDLRPANSTRTWPPSPRPGSIVAPSRRNFRSSSGWSLYCFTPLRINRQPRRRKGAKAHTEKYLAWGWWTTMAEVDCSGSSWSSSVSATPISSARSSSNKRRWS